MCRKKALRAQYECVREGYYMNKQHWITVDLVDVVPSAVMRELITDSYRIVFESLPKKTQAALLAPAAGAPNSSTKKNV